MPTPIASDFFNRADTSSGLGTADTGQVWSTLVGIMQISGNRARATSNARAASVINIGAGSADLTIDVDCGSGSAKDGYALYFRVTDASNWWRLNVNAGSYSYVSGSHQVISGSYQQWDGTWYVGPWYSDGQVYPLGPSAWNYAPGIYYSGDVGGGPTGYCYTSSTHYAQYSTRTVSKNYYTVYTYDTVTDYSTAYTWDLLLQKCVADVVSTVATTALTAAPTHLTVVTAGATITGSCSTGQQVSITDSFNQTATKHGIGYGETATYGNTDGLNNFAISTANLAPNAPVITGLNGEMAVERLATQRLPWTFSDPDVGDTQQSFSLRYRTGTAAWVTITITTANSFWDAPPGTFAVGRWEWQVQVTDTKGTQGLLSASAFFNSADLPPDAPVINIPNIVSSMTDVVWAASSQTNYQVRRVADLDGVADTSTVLYDSGDTVSSATRVVTLTFTVDARYEHVQVRVKTGGTWSYWADRRVYVILLSNFVPPPPLVFARTHLNFPVITPTGDLLKYIDVTFLDADTNLLTTKSLYRTSSPSEKVLRNPVTFTPSVIDVWCDDPVRLNLSISGPDGYHDVIYDIDMTPAPQEIAQASIYNMISTAPSAEMMLFSDGLQQYWKYLDLVAPHDHPGYSTGSVILDSFGTTDYQPNQTWVGYLSGTYTLDTTSASSLGYNGNPAGIGGVVLGANTTIQAQAGFTSNYAVAIGDESGVTQNNVSIGYLAAQTVNQNDAVTLPRNMASVFDFYVNSDSLGLRNMSMTTTAYEIGNAIAKPGVPAGVTYPFWLRGDTVVSGDFSVKGSAVLGSAAGILSCFNEAGSTKRSVATGSTGALASLLTALTAYGLLTVV